MTVTGVGGYGRAAHQLEQAQAAAARLNCHPFPIFGGLPGPQCPAVLAEISRLQWQLHDAQSGSFKDSSAEVLRNELMAAGCAIPSTQASPRAARRALCVRLCDGYYFPIEFSATRQRMKVDEQVCQSMYAKKGQAKLFSYDPNKDVSTATSSDGKRYGDQPYAFQYRQSYDAKCAAELTTGIAALAERYREAMAAKRSGSHVAADILLPALRPSQSEDPETTANSVGHLQIASSRPATGVATPVRVVGPAYYARVYSLRKPVTARPPILPIPGLIGAAQASPIE